MSVSLPHQPIRVDTVAKLLAASTSEIVNEHGDRRDCAEIVASGHELAGRLAASGLQRGDRVAVQLANGDLYLDLLAAAAELGLVIMSVNQRFAEQLADSLITRSGARLVIRSEADLPPLVSSLDPSDGQDRPSTSADDRAQRGPQGADRYVVFTTSGTTSAPKLVAHTQQSIATHAGDVAAGFGYSSDSVVMVPIPLCGVFGFTVLFGALAANATVIMPTTFEPEQTASLIEQHRVTSLHGSDDLFHRLLATTADLSSIETSGYARFNSALEGIVERCEERGIPLSGLYGMSEVQALYAWRGGRGLPLEDRWRPAGPVVSPQADCRVVDGELQLKGPSLFEGYLADGGAEIDHELTTAAYVDGWFRTGDLAEQDGPRSFEYITRIGDAMRLGGFLVAPTEIETVLMQHESVEQAQVVAVGLEKGSRPVAFVIPASGSPIDEAALVAHCQSVLARYKCPVRVVAIDEFPVTDGPNGVKIQRAELRRAGQLLLDG